MNSWLTLFLMYTLLIDWCEGPKKKILKRLDLEFDKKQHSRFGRKSPSPF